ncbi:MAG: hypothetical protein HETSPECPRED_005890 [Heterodermia speciosa]|uniref:Uncharacterized protein n=1 Tax=Heterodermia speciosa TaxID=116794 RepID=A0A8H3FJ94_9LECA|nr:MAG: hypothetical protein HETSPECPRED_005890 [Heterodermia speciosa]
MASLLTLPLELREEIWALVCRQDAPFGLLRTNRQFSCELAPYLYKNVVVHLPNPHQILQWTRRIGTFNSSCVRNLTVKFPALKPTPGTLEDTAISSIWSASLEALCQLDTLIYYYEPSQHYSQQCLGLDSGGACRFTTFERAMEKAGTQGLITRPTGDSHDHDILESLPAAHSRPITHAILAIDEEMPEINMRVFMKLLSIDMSSCFHKKVTGLPTEFFADNGLELVRTYAMIEDPQQHSLALTYRKHHSSSFVKPPSLQTILSNLPRLLYLRLGSPNINSSFLTFLPLTIQTIDVSFRDPDPERVSRNLRFMNERCNKLFTLAIAVSPLHDLLELPDGGRQIDQGSKGEEAISEWEPFWDALKYIQGTGVKVWEGEGPGLKRVRKCLAMNPKSIE